MTSSLALPRRSTNILESQGLSLSGPRIFSTLSCGESGSLMDLRLGGEGLKKTSALTANGYGVSFWGDRNVLELDSADGCTT